MNPPPLSSDENILDLINKLITAGALGRSQVYAKLLNYLAEQSLTGKNCSEFSIAVDVFEKDSDYDITADSTVRVYIYNLRKKLQAYYDGLGKNETQQLYIPKGEYRLIIRNTGDENSKDEPTFSAPPQNQQLSVSSESIDANSRHIDRSPNHLKYALLTVAAMFLTAVLTYWLTKPISVTNFSSQQVQFWGDVLTNDKPVMVVVGDYFIFGELVKNSDEMRLVREFDVNSAEDFRRKNLRINQSGALQNNRIDLGLTYLPRGSAYALAKIQQLLQQAKITPRIAMMSELSADDIRSNHIIYIGYLSGLGVLEGYIFANSRFEIGSSYDDLIDTETLVHYRSDFIEAVEDGEFTDFGTISSFSLAANNQIIAITGTRDAGLMEMADIAITPNLLEQMQLTNEADGLNYEALFEVSGFNATNISSTLIVSGNMMSEE